MLIGSDRIQIASKTTHKDKGTKVNTFYYFTSKYNVRVPCGIPILFQSPFYRCSGDFTSLPTEILISKTNLAYAVLKAIIWRENLRQYLKNKFVSWQVTALVIMPYLLE